MLVRLQASTRSLLEPRSYLAAFDNLDLKATELPMI